MDTTTAAKTALEAWASVVGAANPEPMPHVHNLVWSVVANDGRRFVLRRLPEFPPGVGPVDEFRVLCHLQAAGVPVALPVVTDQAGLYARVGDRSYALLPLLPHDRRNHEHGPDAVATAFAIGAAIARLHQALADCPWPVRSYVDDPVPQVLDQALPALPDEIRQLVAPWVPRLRATVTGLPTQRTHGDCNTGNVLVHGTRVSGFVDLDHLPVGPRVRDLSYYLASRLRLHLAAPRTADRDVAAMLAVLGAYVAGYDDTSPLSDQERAAVVPLMLLVEIGGAHWCLAGWEPDPAGYARHLRTIRWLTSHLEQVVAAATVSPGQLTNGPAPGQPAGPRSASAGQR